MVGAVRFELTTSCTRNKRASQATLRPDPKRRQKLPPTRPKCNDDFRLKRFQKSFWLVAALCERRILAESRLSGGHRPPLQSFGTASSTFALCTFHRPVFESRTWSERSSTGQP